jgi:hypothetical protein
VEDDIVAAGDVDVAHDQEVGLVHDGQGGSQKKNYFRVRSW